MKVAFPEYWIWMLGLPVTLGIIYLVYRRVSYITETWFSPEQYERSLPLIKLGLRMGGFILLFIALLGPYIGGRDQKQNFLGREIFIVLDVSGSMNAEDIKPSRLSFAKRELKELVSNLEGDKIGLILFAEYAYVQCPLTLDRRAVNLFLDMAESGQFAQTGTQFRSALAVAMDRFQNGSGQKGNQTQAIILVSDGEDFGDNYVSLIERLKQAGIMVYTVGVGTYEGAPIPHIVENRKAGYKRYEDGALAISRLVDNGLEALSEAFGTNYVKINQPGKDLFPLEKQVRALTSSPIAASMNKVENNQYQAFLFLALLLLMGSMFIMPIRKI
ncbi:MAG: VWA domain-containing protein [Bacteroidia bacterium]|nr:VWA domain-containing protein [Bacteroidia bacterium]